MLPYIGQCDDSLPGNVLSQYECIPPSEQRRAVIAQESALWMCTNAALKLSKKPVGRSARREQTFGHVSLHAWEQRLDPWVAYKVIGELLVEHFPQPRATLRDAPPLKLA